MTITVIGAGYVGLVTAAVFASFGNKVWCLEIDPDKLEKLKKGQAPFFEPGLEELIKRNLKSKTLEFTADYSQAIPESKIVFICVGTPPKENGEADLNFVSRAVKEMTNHLHDYTVIVGKSTLPIGVGEQMYKLILTDKKPGSTFDWVSNPEFLREGSAIEDSLHPDRIVIGGESQKAIDTILELHAPIDSVAIITDTRSAELIKYASNALLATKVSFANSIATLSELSGCDVEAVLNGVGYDKRLGRSMLYPGIGYGGSCLPKDVLALLDISKKSDYDFELLKAVHHVNQEMVTRFVKKIENSVGSLKGKKIALLGLSYKPNTDDMREAPSIKIVEKLLDKGAKVAVYDPEAMENAKKILPHGVDYATNPYDAAKDASVLAVVTDWNEFKELDLTVLKKQMAESTIIDGRNIYDREKVKAAGFSYQGVGR